MKFFVVLIVIATIASRATCQESISDRISRLEANNAAIEARLASIENKLDALSRVIAPVQAVPQVAVQDATMDESMAMSQGASYGNGSPNARFPRLAARFPLLSRIIHHHKGGGMRGGCGAGG